jgi:predicted outer membrane repeat protein
MHNTGNEDGESNPTIKNTNFSGNWAVGNGGAIYNNGDGEGDDATSSPNLTNVTFSGNKANYGGAMFNDGTRGGESSPILTNVTFSGNSADVYGGAISNSGRLGTCMPNVRNSILWNNKDKSGTGTMSANINNSSSTTTLSYSLVEASGGSGGGWIGGSYDDGGGNIDTDPKFITLVAPSTAPTPAGNLRLQLGSHAIEEGDNLFIAGFSTDLDGEPRIVDGDLDGTPTVDMGAYEFQIDVVYLPLIFH